MLWLNPICGTDAVKLKDWRDQNGKTQQWVADELNRMAAEEGDTEPVVSQSSVDRWEHGTIPRQANMRRILSLTGKDVGFGDFFGDEGPKKRKARDTKISVAASRKGAATKKRQRQALQ